MDENIISIITARKSETIAKKKWIIDIYVMVAD